MLISLWTNLLTGVRMEPQFFGHQGDSLVIMLADVF